MQIRLPLAAALLITTTVAVAQTGNQPAPNFGSFAGGNSYSPLNLTLGAPDDSIFTCGLNCPLVQATQLSRIRDTRLCPAPASNACVLYLM